MLHVWLDGKYHVLCWLVTLLYNVKIICNPVLGSHTSCYGDCTVLYQSLPGRICSPCSIGNYIILLSGIKCLNFFKLVISKQIADSINQIFYICVMFSSFD